MTSKAFMEGWDASEIGTDGKRYRQLEDNPYPEGSKQYAQWILGYIQGVEEDNDNLSS